MTLRSAFFQQESSSDVWSVLWDLPGCILDILPRTWPGSENAESQVSVGFCIKCSMVCLKKSLKVGPTRSVWCAVRLVFMRWQIRSTGPAAYSVMKYSRWFKKDSCHLLAKVWAVSTAAQEKWILARITDRAWHDLEPQIKQQQKTKFHLKFNGHMMYVSVVLHLSQTNYFWQAVFSWTIGAAAWQNQQNDVFQQILRWAPSLLCS